MSTVPKADLARALAVYEWLRSENPHLPPENLVALDVLTVDVDPMETAKVTLTVYINLPDAPFPGAPR